MTLRRRRRSPPSKRYASGHKHHRRTGKAICLLNLSIKVELELAESRDASTTMLATSD